MKPRVKNGLKINPESGTHMGIMSASDQIKYFDGWTYLASSDRFLGPKMKNSKRPMLSPEAFDRLMGGNLFFIGGDVGGAEYTRSASFAFTHTRVIEGFPKLWLPEATAESA